MFKKAISIYNNYLILNKFVKRLFLYLIIPVIVSLAWVNSGESKTESYYSGDAISYRGQLYVASANTNSLELFRLENNTLKRLAGIKPFDSRFGRYGSFYDVKLAVENDQLMAYAISDFSLYKYNLTAGDNLNLLAVQHNTYWEWYSRVNKFGDNIVTISDKGVTIWNTNLETLDSFNLANTDTLYNIRGNNNRFILNIQANSLTVFDRTNRQIVLTIPLNYKEANGNRAAYQDEANQLYAVDDYYAKKYDTQGSLVASFKHLDYPGYDIDASGNTNDVYFSNGIGVVKLNQENMKLVASRWTTDLSGPRGWAMGLKVVYNDGDKVVVFNNANILVLNDKLNKLAAYQAVEQAAPQVTENLFLNLNHNLGTSGTTITLTGGGYFPNEVLAIDFAGVKSQGTTDAQGHFSKDLIVPAVSTGQTAISVIGQSSQLSYSISFRIIP